MTRADLTERARALVFLLREQNPRHQGDDLGRLMLESHIRREWAALLEELAAYPAAARAVAERVSLESLPFAGEQTPWLVEYRPGKRILNFDALIAAGRVHVAALEQAEDPSALLVTSLVQRLARTQATAIELMQERQEAEDLERELDEIAEEVGALEAEVAEAELVVSEAPGLHVDEVDPTGVALAIPTDPAALSRYAGHYAQLLEEDGRAYVAQLTAALGHALAGALADRSSARAFDPGDAPTLIGPTWSIELGAKDLKRLRRLAVDADREKPDAFGPLGHAPNLVIKACARGLRRLEAGAFFKEWAGRGRAAQARGPHIPPNVGGMFADRVVLRKLPEHRDSRGIYWRPDGMGYTDELAEAGHWWPDELTFKHDMSEAVSLLSLLTVGAAATAEGRS